MAWKLPLSRGLGSSRARTASAVRKGFIDAHVDEVFEAAAWASPPPATFFFEDVKHKLHACCHGLHATIEALTEVRSQAAFDPAHVTLVRIRVNPRWLSVCDIKEPHTGLEAKFSFAMLTAMTLNGVNTASEATYTDALCRDRKMVDLWPRVEVIGERAFSDTAARVTIEQGNRRVIEVEHDIAQRLPTETLERALRAKAAALLGEPAAQVLWRQVDGLDTHSARHMSELLSRCANK
jgi:2-methylcitrate dehydratase PrpD